MDEKEKQEYLKTFGNYIRYLRQQRGWSQEELAEKCGYDSKTKKSTIHKIEAGKSDLPASKIQTFADVFGVRPSELIDPPTKIKDEMIICDLVEKCYGKAAYSAVQMFLQLDSEDRDEIVQILTMKLQKSKYQKGVEKLHA